MTQNQINFAKLQEDARHNREQEKLTKEQNKLTKTSVLSQKAHYERSDAYTDAHYQRSDAASMVSANAQAMNAVTNRKNYEMSYDIEYGWTGDEGYPQGTPLSAQLKNAELVYKTQLYDDAKRKAKAEADLTEQQVRNVAAQTAKFIADTDTSKTQALSNVLNALFGRKGLVGVLDTLVSEPTAKGSR